MEQILIAAKFPQSHSIAYYDYVYIFILEFQRNKSIDLNKYNIDRVQTKLSFENINFWLNFKPKAA